MQHLRNLVLATLVVLGASPASAQRQAQWTVNLPNRKVIDAVFTSNKTGGNAVFVASEEATAGSGIDVVATLIREDGSTAWEYRVPSVPDRDERVVAAHWVVLQHGVYALVLVSRYGTDTLRLHHFATNGTVLVDRTRQGYYPPVLACGLDENRGTRIASSGFDLEGKPVVRISSWSRHGEPMGSRLVSPRYGQPVRLFAIGQTILPPRSIYDVHRLTETHYSGWTGDGDVTFGFVDSAFEWGPEVDSLILGQGPGAEILAQTGPIVAARSADSESDYLVLKTGRYPVPWRIAKVPVANRYMAYTSLSTARPGWGLFRMVGLYPHGTGAQSEAGETRVADWLYQAYANTDKAMIVGRINGLLAAEEYQEIGETHIEPQFRRNWYFRSNLPVTYAQGKGRALWGHQANGDSVVVLLQP